MIRIFACGLMTLVGIIGTASALWYNDVGSIPILVLFGVFGLAGVVEGILEKF